MQFMNHRPRVSLNFHFTQPKMNAQFKSLETRHRFSRKSRRGIKVYFDSRSNRSFPSIWRGESTGEYSVRSGYKYLHEGQNQLQINYKQFYKRLWNLELPSKIKITIWRCSRNYLPNYSNLHYKRLMGLATCRRCHTGAETREHLFRDCPVAKEIWEKLNICWPSSVANYDFLEVLITMFESHSISKCRMITCALWAIWANRNRFLHEGESRSGSQVADFVLNYLKELDDLNHFFPIFEEPILLKYEELWMCWIWTKLEIDINCVKYDSYFQSNL